MADPEIWRPVPSLPQFLASSRGRIMIIPRIRPMPKGGVKGESCRARVGTWDGSRYIITHKRKQYKAARLVCEAFNGPPPTSESVCMHLDENARNNRPGNLRWGTQKENLNASGFLEYCRSRTGENNPFLKGRKRIAA
jgi:hypothetical protein